MKQVFDREKTMRKKFISIATFTVLAASSDQIFVDQYDDSATSTEFDYIAVEPGAAVSL